MVNFLPIGTIVTLVNRTKKIMIYGRKQFQAGNTKEWDYVACLYPEGNITEDYNVFFNHDEIDTIYFTGYEDEDELKLKELIKNSGKINLSI